MLRLGPATPLMSWWALFGIGQACGPVATPTPTRTVPTRAVENHVHLVYSNFNGNPLPQAGTMCGQSAVVGPDGIDLRRGPGVEVGGGVCVCVGGGLAPLMLRRFFPRLDWHA